MELPNYMYIVCDLSGDVLEEDAEISIKTIYDLIHNDSKQDFFDYVKHVTTERHFVKYIVVKLNNNLDYYLDLDLYNDRMVFYIQKVKDEIQKSKFFEHIDTKINFFKERQNSLLTSLSNLISDLFYKNRSDIIDVLNALCSALRVQYGLVLFHNGRDHALFCRDMCINKYNFEKIEETKKDLKFDDTKIDQNVLEKITDRLYVKMCQDTYFNIFKPEICSNDRKVYVLKLIFDKKIIGYLEIIPHTFINFTHIDLKVLESLSCILAYIIYNKNEELELYNYIQEKFNNV